MKRVIFASGNRGKLREVKLLLTARGIELLPQADFGVEGAEETAPTFVENALLKARHASRGTGLPAIADDSGLVVDALGGEPGIHSARYAGEAATDAENVDKLLGVLASVPAARRRACFECVMVYLRHPADPTPLIASGRWQGEILDAPRGRDGFGYDPVFFVPEQGRSAAELDAKSKNALSHRGQALRGLVAEMYDGDDDAP